MITTVDAKKLSQNDIKDIIFDIEYCSKTKTYGEICEIHYEAFRDNVSSRASTKDKELKIISYTLQDFVEKLL